MVSLSIAYFQHHPDMPALRFRVPDFPAAPNAEGEAVVDERVLLHHAALISPDRARLWLGQGAFLAGALEAFVAVLFRDRR